METEQFRWTRNAEWNRRRIAALEIDLRHTFSNLDFKLAQLATAEGNRANNQTMKLQTLSEPIQ